MRFEFKPSFGRSVKAFPPQQRDQIKVTAEKLIHFYTTGDKTPGLGITHLRGEFWEGRSSLRERVLYRWRKGLIEFVLGQDRKRVAKLTGLSMSKVHIVGITSSNDPEKATGKFDVVLRWRDLAAEYNHHPDLLRADECFRK